jgi:hypothetical protein
MQGEMLLDRHQPVHGIAPVEVRQIKLRRACLDLDALFESLESSLQLIANLFHVGKQAVPRRLLVGGGSRRTSTRMHARACQGVRRQHALKIRLHGRVRKQARGRSSTGATAGLCNTVAQVRETQCTAVSRCRLVAALP